MWWMFDDHTALALAKALKHYHQSQGWRKELQLCDYWYSDGPSSTPEELLDEDQALACEVLREWGRHIHTDLIDELWLFVPEESSKEILHLVQSRA